MDSDAAALTRAISGRIPEMRARVIVVEPGTFRPADSAGRNVFYEQSGQATMIMPITDTNQASVRSQGMPAT